MTLSGIVIGDVILGAFVNRFAGIVVIFGGKFIVVNFLQFLNASRPIEVTESGIVTVFSPAPVVQSDHQCQ